MYEQSLLNMYFPCKVHHSFLALGNTEVIPAGPRLTINMKCDDEGWTVLLLHGQELETVVSQSSYKLIHVAPAFCSSGIHGHPQRKMTCPAHGQACRWLYVLAMC